MYRVPKIVREAVCAQFHLGQLGFSEESIRLEFWDGGYVGIAWKAYGRTLKIRLGSMGTLSAEEFEERYRKALTDWYAGRIQPWQDIYKESYAYRQRKAIAQSMREEGLPAVGPARLN